MVRQKKKGGVKFCVWRRGEGSRAERARDGKLASCGVVGAKRAGEEV